MAIGKEKQRGSSGVHSPDYKVPGFKGILRN